MEDADLDGRVVDHPKRPVVKAYCGVPIPRTDGSIFGTICHFDFDPVIDEPDAQFGLRVDVHLPEDVSRDLDEFHLVEVGAGLVENLDAHLVNPLMPDPSRRAVAHAVARSAGPRRA